MTAPESIEAVAVALCRQDDTQFHHDRTDDFPCWSCREKAEVAAQALATALGAREQDALGDAWDEGARRGYALYDTRFEYIERDNPYRSERADAVGGEA